ncbi:MAG: hypothetical protein K0R28_5301 [Paenibacillus sp.]|nr:hypothetical protein [Paenibacillus sp.]
MFQTGPRQSPTYMKKSINLRISNYTGVILGFLSKNQHKEGESRRSYAAPQQLFHSLILCAENHLRIIRRRSWLNRRQVSYPFRRVRQFVTFLHLHLVAKLAQYRLPSGRPTHPIVEYIDAVIS